MENKNNTITASEINKFTYCKSQWYFERKYGKKKLMELAKERNEKLNLTDSSKSNFVKGQEFHNNFYKDYVQRKIVGWIILIIMVLAVGFLFFKFYP